MADVDKSLYALPTGVEEDAVDEEAIEIEIEDPESVTISAGDTEITIDPDAAIDDAFNENLAEELDEQILDEIAGELLGEFEADINSRRDWLDTYVDGLELLGLKLEDRSEPWEGACNVFHPLMTRQMPNHW